jgi:hypothetical protein
MRDEDEIEQLEYVCDSYRHLVCRPYTIANLHRMAKELGIHRGWFHGGKFPHYDIPKRRISEIRAKCRVVESREILGIIYGREVNDPAREVQAGGHEPGAP